MRQARQVMNKMLQLAVETGYLVTNPAAGVRTRRQPEPEMLFLTAQEVESLASVIREPYSSQVHLLAYGALRGERRLPLRHKRCHLLRSRIEVGESLSEAFHDLYQQNAAPFEWKFTKTDHAPSSAASTDTNHSPTDPHT